MTQQIEFHDKQISMQHGAGGQATRRLIEGLFAQAFSNPTLDAMGDSALLNIGNHRLAITTDTFVISPHTFPGGTIGSLAIHGTVNDLAVSGAEPLGLTAGFILEAGLKSDKLRFQVQSMADTAKAVGVSIVSGDTKVVENGNADGLYINTTGIGLIRDDANLSPSNVEVGDAILVSGPIGDHGITILIARAEIDLSADLETDSRSILPYTRALLDAVGHDIKWMRDATRGGVATVLNELASDAAKGIVIEESTIPVRDMVRASCELLGLDPLHVANEGQFVAVISKSKADEALAAIQAVPGGEGACIIGHVVKDHPSRVIGRTAHKTRRVIDVLVGDPLPRIC
ncbi:MAG: hydrogenase expression/formation protein HypE [Phycisphaerales bacterium]|nr:hydrogenase expression/formation protein HypE [Phycisphaerales bacterium]